MEHPLSATLASLKAELGSYYAALAVVVDECYESGAGDRMLGADSTPVSGMIFDRVNVERSRLGKLLPVWHRYAYEGVMSAGFSAESFMRADSAFERLTDMLGLLSLQDNYFDDAMSASGGAERPRGHLSDMAARVTARVWLDTGSSLSIADLGLLADMNERSVRNATTADGDGRLALSTDGSVTNVEALRWLAGRRGFKPTRFRELPAEHLPDDLLEVELPIFVQRRLAAAWRNAPVEPGAPGDWRHTAAREAGMSLARIEAAMSLPLDIQPQECVGLARAMRIDPVWFTLQVMTALFPQEVDMLLNPERWRREEPAAGLGTTASGPDSVTVILTASMLKHGYIDIPMSASGLFPADCFGTRKEDEQGAQVELLFGSQAAMTDIRQKSSQTLSPRKRFNAWLNTELSAKVGDRIHVSRTAERQYKLTHIAV